MNKMIRSPYSKVKREHFFIIDNDYVKLYAKHLGVMATAVFTSLNMHADAEGKCFPSMALIAEQHGIDRHTVSRALKKLEEWNMINVGRAYNRKLKRNKNNTYNLILRRFWKDLPVEDEVIDIIDYGIENTIESDDLPWCDDSDKSHGTENATYMASKIPDYGTEDASNKTHIIRTIEEDSLCGQKPTELSLSLSKKSKLLKEVKYKKSKLEDSKSAVWSSDKAVLALIKNSCKDYQIIGEYFFIQKYSFINRIAYVKAVERSLRAAKSLMGYKIDDIRKTMQWLNNAEFDYDGIGRTDISWSLEAVNRYINDCVKTNFIPNGTSRIELLNKLNTIKIPNESATQLETIAFTTFWNSYPRKADKISAEEAFKKLDPQTYPKIMESIEKQKKTEQWQKAEYIPLASNWLEKQRWEDEVVASSIDPMEAYARELARQFPPDKSTTAEFRFSAKYGMENLLRFKYILM